MDTTLTPLLSLTAADLMTHVVVCLQEAMSLREAAEILIQHRVGGAPVIDVQGHCVGMLSTVDFMRLAEKRFDVSRAADPAMPITCPFWVRETDAKGQNIARCTLPAGVCPLQVSRRRNGDSVVVCGEPHSVCTDWQLVETEKLPADAVRNFMSTDPVMVTPDTPMCELAQAMIDTHVHRLVVANRDRCPIGIVSATDILSALARAG